MKKTVVLFCICFLICVNYYLLRTMKDALILTEAGSGAEIIPFLKTWALLPFTFILTVAFTRLSNRWNYSFLFQTVICFFLFFYLSFAFLLYPFLPSLQLTSLANSLTLLLPSGWGGFIDIIRFWPLTLFYVMAECWAVIVWYILFSGFTNQILTISEAKKTYPILIIAGSGGAVAAGLLTTFLSSYPWTLSFPMLTSFVGVCGGGAVLLFGMVQNQISEKFVVDSEEKMHFAESLKFLFQSKYLLTLLVITFGFNLLINLSEVIWKEQVLLSYPDPAAFNGYMGKVTVGIGILSLAVALICSSGLLEAISWQKAALLPPLVLFMTAMLFFTALMFHLFGSYPVASVVLSLGSFHILASRSIRYSLQDVLKEIAYIPLPPDLKFKGKIHIDGTGSRLGKCTASAIWQALFLFFPSAAYCTPIVTIFLLGMMILILLSISYVGQQLQVAEKI